MLSVSTTRKAVRVPGSAAGVRGKVSAVAIRASWAGPRGDQLAVFTPTRPGSTSVTRKSTPGERETGRQLTVGRAVRPPRPAVSSPHDDPAPPARRPEGRP